MLLKLVLLVPTIFSIALCSYLLVGISLYFRSLYKTAPAGNFSRTRRAGRVAAASSKIEAIPAT